MIWLCSLLKWKGKVIEMKQYLILFFTVLFVCGIRGAPLSMKGESVEITRDIVVFENNLQKCLDKTIEETPKLLQQRQEELKDRYLVEFQDRFDDHLLRLYAEAPEISQTRKNSESSPSGRRHGSKSRLMVMYRLIDSLTSMRKRRQNSYPLTLILRTNTTSSTMNTVN